MTSKKTALLALTITLLLMPSGIVSAQPVDFGDSPVQLDERWHGVVIGGFDQKADGFAGVRSMVVFDEQLYASMFASDAYIWRTSDGLQWEQVGGEFERSMFVGPMIVFNDQLFVAAWNDDIYKTSDGITWTAIGVPFQSSTRGVTSFADFDGALYAGLWRDERGAEIWRSFDGQEWSMVASGGFDDVANTGVLSMISGFGALYAGTHNEETGAEVWRSFDGTTWTQLNADGFGDIENARIADLFASPDGHLYAATENMSGASVWRSPSGFNWEVVTQNAFGGEGVSGEGFVEYDGCLWIGMSGQHKGGVEVWRSRDGLNWESTTPAGLGGSHNEAIMAIEVFNDTLYAGTFGGLSEEIWRLDTDFFTH